MSRPGPAALAVYLLLAACGAEHHVTRPSTSRPGSAVLSVRPSAPKATSRISFAFTAPATAGRHGPSLLSFALAVSGPRHAGCVGPRTTAVPRAVKGQTATVVLGPHWCPGAYTARVQEFARPFCKRGQMCPQYIRLVGTLASARFRVAPA